MSCGIYGALSEAGWGVSGTTSVSGSAVVTLGEATSLGFILGVTLGDGTWLGITLQERHGASGGDIIGVDGVGCLGVRVRVVQPC
jgi:hypothetical protein